MLAFTQGVIMQFTKAVSMLFLIPLLSAQPVTAAVGPQSAGQPQSAAVSSLAVTVRIEGGAAAKNIIKDLRVFLCPAQAADDIRAVRKTGALIAQQSGPYKAMLSDLVFMTGRAERAAVRELATDAQGRCTFEQIEPGAYVLFAGCRGERGAGYWMLPVTVSKDNTTRVTLSSKQFTEYAADR